MTAAAPRTTTHFDVDQLTVDDSESLLSLHAFLREQSQMDEEMSAGMHCPDVDGDKQGPVDGAPRDAIALTTLPTGETAALASSTNSTIHPKPSIYSLHSFLRQPGPLELADMPVELLVKILDMVVAVR